MNFSYNKVIEKRKALKSKKSKHITSFFMGCLKLSLYMILLVVVVIGFSGLGMLRGMIQSAPDVDTLSVTPTGYSTNVYDSENNLTTTLLKSGTNRQEISIQEMPKCLQFAFIDIEDERFMDHNGIDLKGILRAGVVAIKNKNLSEGASTITQQLLKNNVFEEGGQESSYGALFKRKFQEQYLALELEKTTTKSNILQSYLNTINLGANTLGVQAAAKRYFNKNASELNISESACIAAITQNPTAFNPITHPEKNAKRRAKVLKNMKKNGHISDAEYEEALADDVYTRIHTVNVQTPTESSPYSYFEDALIEEIIKDLQEQKGYTVAQARNVLYGGGLSIYTTQDPAIQQICDEEVNNPSNYPMAVTYKLNWSLTLMHPDGTEQRYTANDFAEYYKARTGSSEMKLIRDTAMCDSLLEEYRIGITQDGSTIQEGSESKEYIIQPQMSFTVMDQKTGQVKAMVGGRGEKTGSLTLNRAAGTTRQPGSCFKILAAYAPALDTAGYSLSSTIKDAPFNYANGRPVKNWWGNSYRGDSTLREGIYDSMNVVTVKLLTEITPELGFQYTENFGISTLVKERVVDGQVVATDVAQPLALGGITDGVKNIELCAAYAAIANNGTYIEPVYYTKVLDHDGKVLLEANPTTRQVIKDSTAWLLTNAMQDVVSKGTGKACAVSGTTVAGKTGTTQDDNDLWFAGYTPYLTATVWLGYDENASLAGYGAVHEKLWSRVVKRIDDVKGYTEDIGFPKPDSVIEKKVCASTGKLANGGCPAVTEYFANGTVPTAYCSYHGSSRRSSSSESQSSSSNSQNSSNSSSQNNSSTSQNNSQSNSSESQSQSSSSNSQNSSSGGQNSESGEE